MAVQQAPVQPVQIIPPPQSQPSQPAPPVTQIIYAQPPAAQQQVPPQPQPYPYPYSYPPGPNAQPPTTQMNVVMTVPPGGYGMATPYFAPPRKSVGLAVLLSWLLGPLGMFYSTIAGGLVMLLVGVLWGLFLVLPEIIIRSDIIVTNEFFINILNAGYRATHEAGWWTAGTGVFIIICMLWAGLAAASYNNKMAMRYR